MRELPQLCQTQRALAPSWSARCRWETQQCMVSLPIHTHPPMCLAGVLREASERRKPEKHVSERSPPWCLLMLLERGRGLRSSEQTPMQDIESSATHTRAVNAAPNAPLSVDKRCGPAGCPRKSRACGTEHINRCVYASGAGSDCPAVVLSGCAGCTRLLTRGQAL